MYAYVYLVYLYVYIYIYIYKLLQRKHACLLVSQTRPPLEGTPLPGIGEGREAGISMYICLYLYIHIYIYIYINSSNLNPPFP